MQHLPGQFEVPRMIVFGGGMGGSYTAAGLAEHIPQVVAETHADAEALLSPMLGRPPEKLVTLVQGTADDGSYTGIGREIFGTPPVGDSRKAISISARHKKAGKIFDYRFGETDTLQSMQEKGEEWMDSLSREGSTYDLERAQDALSLGLVAASEIMARPGYQRKERHHNPLWGHNFGSLVLVGLTREGNLGQAIDEMSAAHDTSIDILPVTLRGNTLYMRDGDEIIRAEKRIDEHRIRHPEDVEVWLEHDHPLNSRVAAAAERAGAGLMAAGSIYTSGAQVAIPAQGAIKGLNGPFGLATNLVQTAHETRGLPAQAYPGKHEPYTGRPFDFMLYNTNLAGAAALGEGEPVPYDLARLADLDVAAYGGDLVGGGIEHNGNDVIARSGVRHAADALASMFVRQVLPDYHARELARL